MITKLDSQNSYYQLMRTILALLLACVVFCTTANAQVKPIESHIIKGRLYKIFWETAVAVESEMCRQFIQREKKLPQKLYYYYGIYSFQQGDIKKARECFQTAKIKFSQNSADIHFALAELWLKACDYKLEGQEFERKPSLRPAQQLRYMSELGYLLVLLEIDPNSKLCQNAYEQAQIQQVANLDIFRKNFGFVALRQGNLKVAKEQFDKIAHRTPEYSERFDEVKTKDGDTISITVEFFDPIILRHLSEYYFKQAQKLCSVRQKASRYLLGVINRELGEIESAISNFEYVLATTTDEPQKYRTRIQLGICFHLLGEKERAETAWTEAAQSEYPQVISELGEAYIHLGIRLQDAVQLGEKSRSLLRALPENRKRAEWWFYENSEDFKQYTWNLVWAYFKRGERQKALNELENVYLPNERHSLDVYETEDGRGREYLSLLRHLNLAKLGKLYYDLTRYGDMRYYIYLKDRMFPRPDYYPETFQIFQTLEHLILYKDTQTPALVARQPDTETPRLAEEEQPPKEKAQAKEKTKTPIGMYVLMLTISIVIIGCVVYRFVRKKP